MKKKKNNDENNNREEYLTKNNLFETPTKQIKTMRKMLNINSFFEEIERVKTKKISKKKL
jgi:hypothetical protein